MFKKYKDGRNGKFLESDEISIREATLNFGTESTGKRVTLYFSDNKKEFGFVIGEKKGYKISTGGRVSIIKSPVKKKLAIFIKNKGRYKFVYDKKLKINIVNLENKLK